MRTWFMVCLLALSLTSAAFAQPYLGPALPAGIEPGLPDYSNCPVPSCDNICPPGAIQENEFCPSLEDQTNGGCFMDVPQFTDVSCNTDICGSIFSRFLVRDTDWFRLVLAEQETLRVCVAGQFPVLIALIQAGPVDPCTDWTILAADSVTDCPCQRICINQILPPGTYFIVVTSAVFNCAENCVNYLLEINCGEGGEQLPDVWDMGDIQECYPTDVRNPGHRITEIAWLGGAVDAEDVPQILDQDEFDDGVDYIDPPWLPCSEVQVRVRVTGGINYAAFADTGGVLYLNGWKDGNLDCDFCDALCDGAAPEWIVQNAVVTPGFHSFSFPDPGVLNLGRYEGRFRWRLTERPLGACETGGTDDIGEVEDYIIPDLQLAVSMLGGLLADAGDGSVTLSWATASETQNDRFEITRNGALCGTLPGAGTSATRRDYTFTDEGLTNGRTYAYTLYSVDANGVREELARVNAMPSSDLGVVTDYALFQNYPNPFNPATTISFALLEPALVTLKVYNLSGQEVATVVSGNLTAGRHNVSFDAGNLPSGAYLYRIETANFTQTKKMLLMK